MLKLGQLIQFWGPPLGIAPERWSLLQEQPLGSVCTDSRRLTPGAFFVPLVGEQFDGHAFLADAACLGAQAALVAANTKTSVPDGLLHWRVDDTTLAYQQLANLHRQHLAAAVVAVTGSAGKTTTRELISNQRNKKSAWRQPPAVGADQT